jgi:hypothetical protein
MRNCLKSEKTSQSGVRGMSKIDYRKVIELMAKSLKYEKKVETTNPEKEINIFEVEFTSINDSIKICRITVNEYDLEIGFPKKYFTDHREYDKWINAFEYELEQSFFKNIKIDLGDDLMNHKIRVHF